MATQTATFAVTVDSLVPAGLTEISNTASIADDGANGPDATPGNNTATDQTPVAATPDLMLSKDDGGAAAPPGATVVYTLSYANVGNQGATGVVLSETVPANSSFNGQALQAGSAHLTAVPAAPAPMPSAPSPEAEQTVRSTSP